MKYKISKNMYLFASAFIALVAIYIGFTILRRTHEGLSDGASTTNDVTIAQSAFYDASTTEILARLKSDPTSYINLITSYKNNFMASAIENAVKRDTSLFANITDYDEVIDYLKSLGVSDTMSIDPNIDATITENNKRTSDILFKLSADNQAYIDLLTSFKNNKIASQIQGIVSITPTKISKNNTIQIRTDLKISDVDPIIDYLRNLAGIIVSTKIDEPTTPNISLTSS